MENKPRYLRADDRVLIFESVENHCDVCVPDQALSVREVLARYVREQKTLPVPVQYDIDSIEEQFESITIPQFVSREDALHLADKARSIIYSLEHASSNASKLAFETSNKPPQDVETSEDLAGT